jgi:hypothetical protein
MLSIVSEGIKCYQLYVSSFLIFFHVHSAFSLPSVLTFYDTELASAEGVQQGNFIGPLLFCLAIHSLVTKLRSEFTIFYLDASTIGGDLCNISRDLKTLEEEGRDLGL